MVNETFHKLAVRVKSLMSNFKYYTDSVYSKYVSCLIKHVGSGFHTERGLRVNGFDHITIGDNVRIGRQTILTAFGSWNDVEYAPNIIIGDNCNIGDFNHISCINSIEFGTGVLTGRWVTITDNGHGDSEEIVNGTSPADRKLFSRGGGKNWQQCLDGRQGYNFARCLIR